MARRRPVEGRAPGGLRVARRRRFGPGPAVDYRKAGDAPFLRELIIPFGRTGYVALFEVEDAATVTILAVRHQLEDDYH